MTDTRIEAKPTVSIPGGTAKAVSSLGKLVSWAKHHTAYDAAITGLRHFLFVIPALAILSGIGLDAALTALATRSRMVAFGGGLR